MKRSLNQNFGEAIFCFAYLMIYCKSIAFEFFFPLPLCLPPFTPAFHPFTFCLFFASNMYLLKFCCIVGDSLCVGLPQWFNGKESTCQSRRCGFDPQVKKTPLKKEIATTPIFLPGKYHGQRSLVDHSPLSFKIAGHVQFSSVQLLSRVQLFATP